MRQELQDALAHVTAERDHARAERELLAAVLTVADDAMIVVAADGQERLRNAAAERFRNARRSDAVAQEAIGQALDEARSGAEVEREVALRGPPQEVLQVRAVPLRAPGRIVGAIAFVHDVTELKRVEAVRRDFVANVTHELKTPIGAVALLAETMTGGYDPTVMRQLSEQIVHEADRLADIVDDLLDLSLIEARTPTREPVQLRALCDEAVERVRALAQVKRIALEAALPPAEVVVECDPRQVVIAIANLLENAVKYSDEGQPVELHAYKRDGSAVIEVRDRGIGIPTTDLERIFERFYRVDKARSRETGGTGLGLSIVRHVAEGHGGDVTVESREGEGSTFRLVLALGDGSFTDDTMNDSVPETIGETMSDRSSVDEALAVSGWADKTEPG